MYKIQIQNLQALYSDLNKDYLPLGTHSEWHDHLFSVFTLLL